MAKKASKKSAKKTAKKSAAKKTAKKAVKKAAKKVVKKTAKKATGKRELIKPKGDARYIRRNAKGQIVESDDVGRSLAADRRTRAETKVSPGEGDRGDR